MDALLVPRVLATLCLDGSLAVLTGLIFASQWLRPSQPEESVPGPGFAALAFCFFAGLLALACGAHFFLMTADFSGVTSLRECLQQMPAMWFTHAGRIDAEAFGAAFLLFVATLFRLRGVSRLRLLAPLLGAVLLLRSASGHAAVEGDFTLAELFQALHLACMAVWSGCILVSALYVLPRIAGANSEDTSGHRVPDPATRPKAAPARFHSYMTRLSQASTWAVALVILSGLWKSYHALGGNVHLLRSAAWGYVLVVKTVCVALALVLGGVNRLWLSRAPSWNSNEVRRSLNALRWEAACMLAVLVLSAALGNLSPPQSP